MFGSSNQSAPAVFEAIMPVSKNSLTWACGLNRPFSESAMLECASGWSTAVGIMPLGIPSDTSTARASLKFLNCVGVVPGVPTRLAVFW